MANYLVFQVCANLGSYGSQFAVGTNRYTDNKPIFSQIVGLIAAALGLERDDEQINHLYDDYDLACMVIPTKGFKITDFHTLIGKDKNQGALISRREYLTDVLFDVALKVKDQNLNSSVLFNLENIAQALKHPAFALYVGRRSCAVSLPLDPMIINCSSFVEAFQTYFKNRQVGTPLIENMLHLSQFNRFNGYFDLKDSVGIDVKLVWQGLQKIAGVDVFSTTYLRDRCVNRKSMRFIERPVSYSSVRLEV